VPPRLPHVSDCSSAWNVTATSSNDQLMMPRYMAWEDGVLYQAAWSAILAMTADGSVQQTLVADVHPTGIWVEGDNVLYSVGSQLRQVPRAGGSSTVIVDGGPVPDPSAPSGKTQIVGEPTILDAAYFYWPSVPYDTLGTLVSRIPRSGGSAELIAKAPILSGGLMALVSDGVLAAGFDGEGYSAIIAPFGGGPFRLLDADFRSYVSLLSVESAGAIWLAPTPAGGYVPMLSPSDGSPAMPLSGTLSADILWDWVYPDGKGGHFLSALERFDDGNLYRSVFFLAASGNTTRLACEPLPVFSDIRGTALAPDALYLTVNRWGGDPWSIVRVPSEAP
jgi:hypothetical protein